MVRVQIRADRTGIAGINMKSGGRRDMRNIEAVIFDWAGTTVDYGCMAPVQAFV